MPRKLLLACVGAEPTSWIGCPIGGCARFFPQPSDGWGGARSETRLASGPPGTRSRTERMCYARLGSAEASKGDLVACDRTLL